MFITCMYIYVCIHMYVCKCVHRHSLRTSRKVFHFIRAVSLEIASDGTVRGDGPSAARYVSFFQDTFSLTSSRTYTQSRRTIIKKIEGEASLLIRPANCGTSPSNPSAILDPIIFEEKHSLSLSLFSFLSNFRISPRRSFTRDSLPLFLSAQWNMDICVAICTDSWRARVAESSYSPQKWNTFTTIAFRFPFVTWNPRNGFCRYRKCHGAEFLAENRGQLYTFLNVSPPSHYENLAEKFSDVQKIFSKVIQWYFL